jgi:hypothetical protein
MNHTLTPNRIYRRNRRYAWLALLLIVVFVLAVVIAPIWLIQPFRPQTPRGLEISFALRRVSPVLTIVASSIVFIMAVLLWRGSRWFGKVLIVLVSVPLIAATWMSRQNHFEWMFRPHASLAYASVSATDFVNDSDMVLAVLKNGEAAAYPVRLMAYHHLVQDVVGGTPIVATY